MAEFADYRWLVESDAAARLLEELAQDARPALVQLDMLRRQAPVERARLLVEQAGLRRRARAKFGDAAARMFFTPRLLEQATDFRIASHKAARYAALADGITLHDYCCGLGGDAAALARIASCVGYDLAETACLMAQANVSVLGGAAARFAARTVDVADSTPAANDAWHVDPDRRATGGRSTAVEFHSPGPEVIDRWRGASATGAVKLAPAAQPPADWQAQGELQWISSNRECRQLVAWFGRLAAAAGRRTATVVHSTSSVAENSDSSSFSGLPSAAANVADQPLQYLFDPDPSLIAANLAGAFANEHGLPTLGAGSVYLTGESPLPARLVQCFQVRDCLPWRTRDVAKYLAARGVGQVEVKTRGVSVDPERVRRELKLRGDYAATVVLTRINRRQVAIIAERR